MALRNTSPANAGGQFTADKDYFGETEDGRSFLKVAKGVTIPMVEAVELGVLKGAKTEDPAEEGSKAKGPSKNKASKPADDKGGDDETGDKGGDENG
jgi:hypothetical protein